MKHRGERWKRWGEGGLIAVALLLALVVSLVVYLDRIPAAESHLPIRGVSYDALRTVEMVDINGASVEKLARLPGIGEVLAQRIVDYREAHGPFATVEGLLRVEGIGEGKLDAVRGEIYVD